MNKIMKGLSASALMTYAFTLSVNVASATALTSMTWGYKNAPKGVKTDIVDSIMNITNFILGFIAMIATLVIIYGGFQYLTAAGNEDSVANAKKTISYGVIGMVICGLAYAMVIVVSTVVLT